MRCAALGTSNRVPFAPRISGFKTSLEIFGLGRTHQVSQLLCSSGSTSVALNVHDPALPVDPVGGDVLPLPGEPPSQIPAKMVRVMG